MIRAQLFLNEKSGTLSSMPQWPPTPQLKDHWVKEASRSGYSHTKRLERKVVKVRGCRVSYEAQDGQTKTCSKDAFIRWCDDGRAKALRLKNWWVAYKLDGTLTLKRKGVRKWKR